MPPVEPVELAAVPTLMAQVEMGVRESSVQMEQSQLTVG